MRTVLAIALVATLAGCARHDAASASERGEHADTARHDEARGDEHPGHEGKPGEDKASSSELAPGKF